MRLLQPHKPAKPSLQPRDHIFRHVTTSSRTLPLQLGNLSHRIHHSTLHTTARGIRHTRAGAIGLARRRDIT